MSAGQQTPTPPAPPQKKEQPQNLAELKPKAFMEPETGIIYEIYPIQEGKKITFNLDGIPFKFANFLYITTRVEENALTGGFIHAPRVPAEDLIKINETIEFPPKGEDEPPMTKEEVLELGELDVRFEIKEEAITKFINPKFANIKSIKQLFALRDDIGGSVVLDFYYYKMILLQPPFELPEEGEEGAEEE